MTSMCLCFDGHGGGWEELVCEQWDGDGFLEWPQPPRGDSWNVAICAIIAPHII